MKLHKTCQTDLLGNFSCSRVYFTFSQRALSSHGTRGACIKTQTSVLTVGRIEARSKRRRSIQKAIGHFSYVFGYQRETTPESVEMVPSLLICICGEQLENSIQIAPSVNILMSAFLLNHVHPNPFVHTDNSIVNAAQLSFLALTERYFMKDIL